MAYKDDDKKTSWSDKYKTLEAKTLAKIDAEEDDVLSILAYAVDSNMFLKDDEDKANFIWDIIDAHPELNDPQQWIDDVFEKLERDAYEDHLSQKEDEATNPW